MAEDEQRAFSPFSDLVVRPLGADYVVLYKTREDGEVVALELRALRPGVPGIDSRLCRSVRLGQDIRQEGVLRQRGEPAVLAPAPSPPRGGRV